ATYGPALTLQTTPTNFGDSTVGDACTANGSELDGAYGYVGFDGRLHLVLTGNLESNFNKLEIFIDSVAGGQNELRNDNPDVDFNGLNRMGGTGEPTVFTAGDQAFAHGSEIDGVFAHVDEANGFLHVLVTGNIQSSCESASDMAASDAVPKMHLFIDANEAEGQNQILFDNPNVSFNNFVGSMAGLTFDAGFTADYWAAVHTEFVPVVRAMDALRLR